ncbi:hypothetical protein J544_3718 [Acinetobacter baumannii 1461963]|nr:hypothetical protein J544_3718 [Acinetobacter baumannii 1461963]
MLWQNSQKKELAMHIHKFIGSHCQNLYRHHLNHFKAARLP